MGYKMTTVAILCLLLLERFLASDMDIFTEPVLRGLRVLEKSALRYTKNVLPTEILTRNKKICKFFLFTRDTGSGGVPLRIDEKSGFMYFHPNLQTKIIVHGFLDKVKIAEWMHLLKDEFLLYDHFNVIIVDWSKGNFLPYSQAAANTEKAGAEIAKLVHLLVGTYGAEASKFHIIGHSLGAHVAGYVGEHVQGLKRISGLDPATHLFSSASARSKLDRTDANFVDVIHTDAGGIGMVETVGHVDFYPNGGEVQPGCTASNSVRSLIEKGVVEGVRNVICSHMRAANLYIDTVNPRHCTMYGYHCSTKEAFQRGECDSCAGTGCPVMGFHVDTEKRFENGTKFFLLTSKKVPFCGYEYKLTLSRVKEGDKSWRDAFRRRSQWSSVDILHIFVYGSKGSTEFSLEGNDKEVFQASHVVFSSFDLGIVHGAVTRWTKKPITRTKGVVNTLSSVLSRDTGHPFINMIQVKPLKSIEWNNGIGFILCLNPPMTTEQIQKGSTFRTDYC